MYIPAQIDTAIRILPPAEVLLMLPPWEQQE